MTVVVTDKEAASIVNQLSVDLEATRAQAFSHLKRAAERYSSDPAAYDEAIDQAKREIYAKP
jgi:hypothetical protein